MPAPEGVSPSRMPSRSARTRASSADGVVPSTHSAGRTLNGWMNSSIVPLLAQAIGCCSTPGSGSACSLQMRTSLGSPAAMAACAAAMTTPLAHPPPIQPCRLPSGITTACAPT
jgi:hypothetical protein